MNSIEIVDNFIKCHEHIVGPTLTLRHGRSIDSSCKTQLINDIDNYIYNYKIYILFFSWLICILYIIYINNLFIRIMKKCYYFSLYLIGYKKRHNKIHILENKIGEIEDRISILEHNNNKKI